MRISLNFLFRKYLHYSESTAIVNVRITLMRVTTMKLHLIIGFKITSKLYKPLANKLALIYWWRYGDKATSRLIGKRITAKTLMK